MNFFGLDRTQPSCYDQRYWKKSHWLDRLRYAIGWRLECWGCGLQLPEYTKHEPIAPCPCEHPVTPEQFESAVKDAFPPTTDDDLFTPSGFEAWLPK